jgi:hypothetical protein
LKVRVRIKSKSIGEVLAELTDEYSPKTFNEVVKALPIEGVASIWGSEIYFPIPVFVDEENSFEVVEKGAIAYWPPGNSLCIFWGPTPASRHRDEIRPASPVNIVGRVLGDPEVFSKVRFREKIIIEKV